jgi:hypothetical protein
MGKAFWLPQPLPMPTEGSSSDSRASDDPSWGSGSGRPAGPGTRVLAASAEAPSAPGLRPVSAESRPSAEVCELPSRRPGEGASTDEPSAPAASRAAAVALVASLTEEFTLMGSPGLPGWGRCPSSFGSDDRARSSMAFSAALLISSRALIMPPKVRRSRGLSIFNPRLVSMLINSLGAGRACWPAGNKPAYY